MPKFHSMIDKYVLTALIASSLCYLFPYTWDDWAWGSAIGLRRLAVWFDDYNGRYVGNLIVLVLTRFRMLRAIAMSFTFTGTVYCVERITQRRWAFTVGLVGLLLIPRFVFRQAVSWISGFANYSTSAFLTLVYFVYLNEHQPDKECSCSVMTGIFLAVLGICNTLIVEHLTVYHVIISVCLFLYSTKINNKIRTDYLIYMISCIAGAVYMFSNSIFQSIISDPTTYYHIAEGGAVYLALKNYFGMIYHQGYYHNWFVNIVLYVTCFLLFNQLKKNYPRHPKMHVLTICIIIMSVFLISSLLVLILCGYSYIDYDHLLKVGLEGVITFINLIATVTVTLMTTYRRGINKRIAFLWISFVLMIAPLFEVSPIGSRCFIASYFTLILIVCEAIRCLLEASDINVLKFRKYFKGISTVVILFATGFYFRIFTKIYHAEQQRFQIIQEAVAQNSESVSLGHLPYEEWIWFSTPRKDNDVWEYRFKLFYGIPDEMDLIIVDDNINNSN